MKEIKNILICGAGMMGKNIGYVFASNPSFQVGMYDLYPTDVEAASAPTPGSSWTRASSPSRS